MNGWLVLGVVAAIAVLGFVGQRAGFIDLRDKRRSSGMTGVFGSIDEVFAPTRHEAQQELDRQTILPIPAPVPGDGDRGIAFLYAANPAASPAASPVANSAANPAANSAANGPASIDLASASRAGKHSITIELPRS